MITVRPNKKSFVVKGQRKGRHDRSTVSAEDSSHAERKQESY